MAKNGETNVVWLSAAVYGEGALHDDAKMGCVAD